MLELPRLRPWEFQSLLESIYLMSLCSLGNKTDKLFNRASKNSLLSVTLNSCKPGEVNPPWTLHYICLAFYSKEWAAYWSWCIREIRGDRICFYISEGWCIDVTVLKKICCPHLQALFIKSKPFYSPQEFSFLYSGQCLHPASSLCE